MILEGKEKFCDRVDKCREEQVGQANLNGTITAKLENIEQGIKDIWTAMQSRQNEIRDLYFRIGMIGGAAGAVSGIVTSLIIRGMGK